MRIHFKGNHCRMPSAPRHDQYIKPIWSRSLYTPRQCYLSDESSDGQCVRGGCVSFCGVGCNLESSRQSATEFDPIGCGQYCMGFNEGWSCGGQRINWEKHEVNYGIMRHTQTFQSIEALSVRDTRLLEISSPERLVSYDSFTKPQMNVINHLFI